ncbi:hypothetical protein BCV70DRAFT_53930 [Testicularia cyperi]|uniref:Uncharacterized protein n=1 Tax=Testicularia cyperi TaxID=1882483 RepID=A0A317XUH7_9BASI|nr:hypothetical protein BCV70DRAFT_53930 [Testicularia cyperi]
MRKHLLSSVRLLQRTTKPDILVSPSGRSRARASSSFVAAYHIFIFFGLRISRFLLAESTSEHGCTLRTGGRLGGSVAGLAIGTWPCRGSAIARDGRGAPGTERYYQNISCCSYSGCSEPARL